MLQNLFSKRQFRLKSGDFWYNVQSTTRNAPYIHLYTCGGISKKDPLSWLLNQVIKSS